LTGRATENDIRKLYTAAATGKRRTASMTSQDRILRIGAGAVMVVWGLVATTPLLLVAGGLAIVFGSYDLLKRTSHGDTVSPSSANELLSSPKPPLLVDIRTDSERAKAMIPGSVHVPLGGSFPERLAEYEAEDGYLLYCETGIRSHRTVKELIRADIQNVRHVDGGIRAWTAERLAQTHKKM
jgi:rhodanese-related sulfurtransferase